MSGTSMDGIDVALLETDGSAEWLQERGHLGIDYDPRFKILLKAAEYALRICCGNIEQAKLYYLSAIKAYLNRINVLEEDYRHQLTELSAYLYGKKNAHQIITLDAVIEHSTDLHGTAVEKLLSITGYHAKQIDVIGYHGQTLFHQPSNKITVAVGDRQRLADRLGITVVNQFRQLDIAFGGQGAPLAPLYHQALAIRDNKIPVAVINCGGIANITLISNAHAQDLIAFDTGPGNGLIDELVRLRTQGKEQMDTDGKYGLQGKINVDLLNTLYQNAVFKDGYHYFSIKPPKSLDIGDIKLIPELLSPSCSLEDACATLEAFTADTIVTSVESINGSLPTHWILVGGGWKNPVIRQQLEIRLRQKLGSHLIILAAEQIGWHSQAIEAQIFAFLAVRSLRNKPLSVPGTTGVLKPVSGGHAYIPPTGATKAVADLIEKNPAVLHGYKGKTISN